MKSLGRSGWHPGARYQVGEGLQWVRKVNGWHSSTMNALRVVNEKVSKGSDQVDDQGYVAQHRKGIVLAVV